jgi:hypothetical protein
MKGPMLYRHPDQSPAGDRLRPLLSFPSAALVMALSSCLINAGAPEAEP